MKTLKDLIYNILLNSPETRDSDKKLIWEVWKQKGFVRFWDYEFSLSEDAFKSATSPESCRRCRQSLQRSDSLTGRNLIQSTKEIKSKRDKLSREKGYLFIQGKF